MIFFNAIANTHLFKNQDIPVNSNKLKRIVDVDVVGGAAIVVGGVAIGGAAILSLTALTLSPLVLGGVLLAGIALTAGGVSVIAFELFFKNNSVNTLKTNSLTQMKNNEKKLSSTTVTSTISLISSNTKTETSEFVDVAVVRAESLNEIKSISLTGQVIEDSLPTASDDLVIKELDQINQEPDYFEFLPNELILEIFSHLNLATLGAICCVSKNWKQLASEPILWKKAIYREIAFGNDKWAQCFWKDVVKDEDSSEEFSSLPWNDYMTDCKKFKSIFPEKNAKDSLMLFRLPKTLNGRLTLKSIGELAKKFVSGFDTGYRSIWPAIVDELGDKSIDKSRWVLMTKNVLPGSRNKSYREQQQIVAELAEKSLIGYEVPETLESAVCIFSQYFGSNIRLFSNKPWTYTRCKEKVQGYQVVVGGFAPTGLCVRINGFDRDDIGVAVLRKF